MENDNQQHEQKPEAEQHQTGPENLDPTPDPGADNDNENPEPPKGETSENGRVKSFLFQHKNHDYKVEHDGREYFAGRYINRYALYLHGGNNDGAVDWNWLFSFSVDDVSAFNEDFIKGMAESEIDALKA